MMKGMERLGIGGRGGFALWSRASTLAERRYMSVHEHDETMSSLASWVLQSCVFSPITHNLITLALSTDQRGFAINATLIDGRAGHRGAGGRWLVKWRARPAVRESAYSRKIEGRGFPAISRVPSKSPAWMRAKSVREFIT